MGDIQQANQKQSNGKQPSAEFHGVLRQMPFPHRPSVAQAQMLPLSTDSDFEVFCQFDCSELPVYLNIPEHYEILSQLATIASETWPQLSIIARISMPGGMRIPVNLLEDNVLLVEDVAQEEALIKNNQQPVLVIEDRFSRIEIENNNNEIKLRLYLPENLTENSPENLAEDTDNRQQQTSLEPLINYLNSINIQVIEA